MRKLTEYIQEDFTPKELEIIRNDMLEMDVLEPWEICPKTGELLLFSAESKIPTYDSRDYIDEKINF